MPAKTMLSVRDAVRTAAAGKPSWHDRLDSLMPPGPMLSLAQLAKITGFSDRFIMEACDTGALLCYRFGNGPGDKKRTRVARDEAMLFLAQNAQFMPEDFARCLKRLALTRSTHELRLLKDDIERELLRRAASPDRDHAASAVRTAGAG